MADAVAPDSSDAPSDGLSRPIPNQLPCGRKVDALLEAIAENPESPLDQHEAHCSHCRAARAEFRRRWAPIVEAAAAPVTQPSGLSDAVMAAVRADAMRRST